jgi:hypothetical protein
MNPRILAGGAALVGAALALASSDAEACSCVRPSLTASWHDATDTVAVEVLAERRGPQRQLYRVEVIKPFSGCLQPGDRVTIETALYDASCGQQLQVGQRYLLTAYADASRDAFSINLCGYNRLLSDLTREDRDFLSSRQVFCEETGEISCADGSRPVSCIQDPCRAESCDDATICEANYCGGCNAELYGEGWEPVCEDRA